jgi:hypothetical protein
VTDTQSLAYRCLDRHVIHGRADELAFAGSGRPMTYAHLLHDSACIAASLRDVGIAAGAPVTLDALGPRERVIALLAVARLGAELDAQALHVIAGDPPVLTTDETEVAWDVLLHAGRVDPAPAPGRDPDGLADRLLAAHPDVFTVLLEGGTLT